MNAPHTVAETDLAALATGLGGEDAVRHLWKGQYSRRLRWIWQVVDSVAAPVRDEARSAIDAAWQRAPEPVRDLLTQPMVGAWAVTTLRGLDEGAETAGRRLGALAVSAALRAGTAAEAVTMAEGGWVYLPGAGRVRAESPAPRLVTDQGRLWVDGREFPPGGPDRQEPRVLSLAGPPSLEVLVEDVDPHRAVFEVKAADRLSAADLARWRGDLEAGWQLITRHAPGRAAELATGLHSVVPLSKPDPDKARSATSTKTVGVIGLDPPTDPANLAITLVHEFQHSKLAALHTIVPLHHPAEQATMRVPWRTDRRPISGAIQGLYAFLGVADMWRALRASPDLARLAEMRFAEALAFVREPARQVAASDLLTPAGRDFAAGVAAAVDALHDVPVSPAARAAAERSLAAHRARWVP